jgi:hypothetical protein
MIRGDLRWSSGLAARIKEAITYHRFETQTRLVQLEVGAVVALNRDSNRAVEVD